MFGLDERGKVRDRFGFPANNLVITSIDIQSVEPVDQRTRDALQKSVQLAIEITTNSQEAAARWESWESCDSHVILCDSHVISHMFHGIIVTAMWHFLDKHAPYNCRGKKKD